VDGDFPSLNPCLLFLPFEIRLRLGHAFQVVRAVGVLHRMLKEVRYGLSAVHEYAAFAVLVICRPVALLTRCLPLQ
jgi:hypothetical protein